MAGLPPKAQAQTQLSTVVAPQPQAVVREKISDLNGVPAHLRKGITLKAFQEVLVRVGFWTEKKAFASYVRDEQKNPWITEAYGAVKTAEDLNGYDLNECIRKWLKESGNEKFSIVEVLEQEGNAGVGKADVFLSHVQSEKVKDTMVHISTMDDAMTKRQKTKVKSMWIGTKASDGFSATAAVVWIDYFCLRQCQKDFVPEQIVELVNQVGMTYVAFDQDYLNRSFCVLESYATIKNRGFVACKPSTNNDIGEVRARKIKLSVNTAEATTRSQEQKQLIDKYISSTIGHSKLDRVLARKMKNAVAQYTRKDLTFNLCGLGIFCPQDAKMCKDTCGCTLADCCCTGDPCCDLCTCIRQPDDLPNSAVYCCGWARCCPGVLSCLKDKCGCPSCLLCDYEEIMDGNLKKCKCFPLCFYFACIPTPPPCDPLCCVRPSEDWYVGADCCCGWGRVCPMVAGCCPSLLAAEDFYEGTFRGFPLCMFPWCWGEP